MKTSNLYIIKEHGRLLNKSRKYDVYDGNNPDKMLFTMHEKAGPFKSMFRMMTASPLFSSLKMPVQTENGETQFMIRRGANPNASSGFKVMDKNGELKAKLSNKIKFKDDSFIEVFDKDKNLLYKSGISGEANRRNFPVIVYTPGEEKANHAGVATVPNDQIVCEINDKFGKLGKELVEAITFPTKNAYYVKVLKDGLNEFDHQVMLTMAVAADFNSDA